MVVSGKENIARLDLTPDVSALIEGNRVRELTPADAHFISDISSDIDNRNKDRQQRFEKPAVFLSSPWQDDILLDQRSLSLLPSRIEEDRNISVEYDPLLIKQYIDEKNNNYDYDQGTSPHHQTVVDLDDEVVENVDGQTDKRAPVSMLRMGRSGANTNAQGVLRLDGKDKRMVGVLRMGRSDEKRAGVSMLRMGRSGADKRGAVSMLRMGRSGGVDKKAFSMLRLGRSHYEGGDKRSVSILRMGRRGSVNDRQEDEHKVGLLRMGSGYDKDILAEDKRTLAGYNTRKVAEDELSELKRAVRMLRLGRSFSKNEAQTNDIAERVQYLDNDEREKKYVKMLRIGKNGLD